MNEITARTTAKLNGKRTYRIRTFLLVKPYAERNFIPADGDTPAQARIWVAGPYGSQPELILNEDVPADMPESFTLHQAPEACYSVNTPPRKETTTMTLHIDELRPGQLVIGRYHSFTSGRVTDEEPVRFVKLEEGVAHFLRQNDDDVWEPLTIRMFAGNWAYGMAMAPFSIREIDWRPAGVIAVDIHGDDPEAALDFISARLGIPVTDETRIDEMTAEALHVEWDAARLLLR